MTELTGIQELKGTLVVQTGLHIGAGSGEIHIGGTDSPVIKHPLTGKPYIPGSSLKGKMRSLMEWLAGLAGDTDGHPVAYSHLKDLDGDKKSCAETILRLFGGAPVDKDKEAIEKIGPTRLAFRDCFLNEEWLKEITEKRQMATEVKMENSIDRIKGTASNPRNTERVVPGARFDFRLSIKKFSGDRVEEDVYTGLKLLEMDALGGSGSRGYGKISFEDLEMNGESVQETFDQVTPF